MSVHCSSSTPTPKTDAPASGPVAELVLVGGLVETLDPAGPQGATAIAVRDGRIALVGSDADVKAWIGPGTRVVELAGHAVVPGLVDAHMHFQGLGMRRFAVDLVGTSSLDEVRAKIAEAAARAEKGAWIRGRGWDQNDWEAFKKKGLKFPSAKDLDDVAPDNPVMLTRIDGHAIWVNTKAMEAAGVTAKTPSPKGGEILKKGGKPTGIFIDNAMNLVEAKLPPPTKEQIRAALLLAQKECLAAGLVEVHDMGLGKETLDVLRELDQSGALAVRVYAMIDGSIDDLAGVTGSGPIIPGEGSRSKLTVRGVKLFADGALGSRGALLAKPYSDDKKTSGVAVTSAEQLEARVRTAADLGFQVATHAIGDKANTLVLDIYERVFGAKARDARPRVEHAQVIAPADLSRFASLGVIASMQPTHATSDMPWAEQRLGKERLQGAYAWQSLLTRGSTIASGSDAPVEDISPVLGLYAAIARKDQFGAPEGGWMPHERMTPEHALASFTKGAAFAAFREREAGMIKVGFVADLTVLDKSPLTAVEDELSSLQVKQTIVGGEVAFDASVAATKTSTTAE
ncbi:amidohydrolase [Myxococcota bacterium]|nr:amidohydrolase [Myxococcota bacterium]